MTYEEILEALSNYNPDALLLEPRSVYDPCIVGMTDTPEDQWPREPGFIVAVYDAEMCVEAIMEDGECSYTDKKINPVRGAGSRAPFDRYPRPTSRCEAGDGRARATPKEVTSDCSDYPHAG